MIAGAGVAHLLYVVAKSAAGKISAGGRGRFFLWLVGIAREEDGALEFVTGMKLVAQLANLLRDEVSILAFAAEPALYPRVISVLRWQGSQKRPDKIDISMWKAEVGIARVELKRMTRLTVRREINARVKSAVRLRLVAIIAIELLSVHRWNVGRKVSLMIEAQRIGIARVHGLELEFRMVAPERGERFGVTLRRSRQIEHGLLRRLRMSMKRGRRKLHSALRRSLHRFRIIVASRALHARDRFHRSGTAMLLMTRGARAILHHVRFVKRVLLMTGFAFAIERIEPDALVKTLV